MFRTIQLQFDIKTHLCGLLFIFVAVETFILPLFWYTERNFWKLSITVKKTQCLRESNSVQQHRTRDKNQNDSLEKSKSNSAQWWRKVLASNGGPQKKTDTRPLLVRLRFSKICKNETNAFIRRHFNGMRGPRVYDLSCCPFLLYRLPIGSSWNSTRSNATDQISVVLLVKDI